MFNTKKMTCESYFNRYLAGTAVAQEMIEDMRLSPSFSGERIFGRLREEAVMDNVSLLDESEFDYNSFFRLICQHWHKDAS